MSDKNQDLGSGWENLKGLIETLEVDVQKSLQGNKSAGVRSRRGLRQLKSVAADLVKASLALEK